MNISQLYSDWSSYFGPMGKWSQTEIGVGILLAASCAIGFGKGIQAVFAFLLSRKTLANEAGQKRNMARQSFDEKALKKARRNFIEMNCANLDPTKEAQLRGAIGVQESIMRTLDRELREGASKHILILADSGMGKTTPLLNMLAKDLKARPSRQLGFSVVTLARDDSLQRISNIPNKSERILLLDAFDEDAEASKDHRIRLTSIMKAAADFSSIVLTCRTQFFANDEEIPREVGILRIEARPAGQSQDLIFRKIYLLPYSDQQVKKYIRKAIPWWRRKDRLNSAHTIARMGDLANRPMLLAVVPELVKGRKEVHELYELYSFMVESWFVREKSWVNRDSLYEASKLLALNMVLHREARGAECVPESDVAAVLACMKKPIENWQLHGRSLLNRDSAGRLKFSHRSILEYFFIVSMVDGDQRPAQVRWTDQMREFFFSWGRCAIDESSIERAKSILRSDLRVPAPFPIKVTRLSSDINADALHRAFRDPAPLSLMRGLPSRWAPYLLRMLVKPDAFRFYEFSDDLVWRVPKVPTKTSKAINQRHFDFDSIYGLPQETKAEQPSHPWRIERSAYTEKASRRIGRAPTINQLAVLVQYLARGDNLDKVLNNTELYWLANDEVTVRYLINISSTEKSRSLDSMEFIVRRLFSIKLEIAGLECDITVFDSIGAQSSGVVIDTSHSGAAAHFYADSGAI